MGIGFIQDKLEIKFLILYIAARVTEPLTPEDMQDLTMCDDGIDYFDYAECLNDLVKTEHLRLTEAGRYAITDIQTEVSWRNRNVNSFKHQTFNRFCERS